MPRRTEYDNIEDAKRLLFWTWEYTRRNNDFKEAYKKYLDGIFAWEKLCKMTIKDKENPFSEIIAIKNRPETNNCGAWLEDIFHEFTKSQLCLPLDPLKGYDTEQMLSKASDDTPFWAHFNNQFINCELPKSEYIDGKFYIEFNTDKPFEVLTQELKVYYHLIRGLTSSESIKDALAEHKEYSRQRSILTLQKKLVGTKKYLGSKDDWSRALGLWYYDRQPIGPRGAEIEYYKIFSGRQDVKDPPSETRWSKLLKNARESIEKRRPVPFS